MTDLTDRRRSDASMVTVCIATLDRCSALADTLDSLRWQTWTDFDVVVVAGPSTDGTSWMLHQRAGEVQVIDNPMRNLSVSRNLAAAAANAPLLAFIDDDAIATPTWLERHVRHHLGARADGRRLAATGGGVLGPDGRNEQWTDLCVDVFGNVDEPDDVAGALAGRRHYRYPAGTNMVLRRDAVVEVGGFDEHLPYHLDEADLAVRMSLAGWEIDHVVDAWVQHRFLAGAVRAKDDGRTTDWRPVFRSRAWFGLRHAAPQFGEDRVIEEMHVAADEIRPTLADGEREGFEEALADAVAHVHRAPAADARPSALLASLVDAPPIEFPAVATASSAVQLVIAVIESRSGAEEIGDAVVVATSLAHQGIEVHLVTPGQWSATTWGEGVWHHALAVDGMLTTADLNAELKRIDDHRPIDLVVGPPEFVAEGTWPRLSTPPLETAVLRDRLEAALRNEVVLAREVQLAHRRAAELAVHIDDLVKVAAQREESYRTSRSWRVTRPLRAVTAVLARRARG